jgi:class 3 adenylate cyclase
VDYLGRKTPVTCLTAKRLFAVSAYALRQDGHFVDGEQGEGRDAAATWVDAENWQGIVAGKEYRFAFLFVETDQADELKKRYEAEHVAKALESFRAYVDGIVTQHGGRLWMWSRFGGLSLFPLRDSSCPVVICGLRIMLSQIFHDVEQSQLPRPLSFRMALSVGSTVYHETDTGGIVSDAINSIFHLGRRYTRPGRFVMTGEAAFLIPEPLREHCVEEGTFEGRRILRLLRPCSLARAGGTV